MLLKAKVNGKIKNKKNGRRYRHATGEGGAGGGRPPLPFFENKKKCPDCIHLCVKFSIPNVVLRVPRRKTFQNLSLRGLLFLCFWRNVYRSA